MKKTGDSIATKTLIQSGLRIALVILATTYASYHFLSKYLVREHHSTLLSTVSERVSREQILFPEVENYLLGMNAKMMQDNSFSGKNIDSLFAVEFEKRTDGSVRYRSSRFNPVYDAGLFIDDSTEITPELRERILRFNLYNSTFGRALNSKFTNLYVLGTENYLMVYWPELIWTEQVTTEYRIWDEPYFSVSTPENNPARKPVWTPIYYDHVADRWMVSCVVPVYKNGKHIASTGMDILLDDLMERAKREVITGTSNIILSREGKLIVHTEYENKMRMTGGDVTVDQLDDPVLEAIYEHISKEPPPPSGIALFTLSKIPYVVAYGKIEGPDWYYITLYEKKVLWAGVYRGVQIVLLSALIALIIELLILYDTLRRRVETPISDLIHAIRSISNGDFSKEIPDSEGAELNEIKTAFREMQVTIHSQIKSLEESRSEVEKEIDVRKNAEKERLIAFKQLQNIMNSTRLVSIIATDTEGLITHFNNGAQMMLGYSEEEMVGINSPALIHVAAEVEQRAKEIELQFGDTVTGFDVFVYEARQGKYFEREWTYIRKDHTSVTVDLVVTAIKDDSGEIVGFLGVAIDVTQKRRAMDELSRTRLFLHSLINSMPSVIIGISDENRVTFSNRSAQKYLFPGIESPEGELFARAFPYFATLNTTISDVRSSGKAYTERNGVISIKSKEHVFDQAVYPVQHVSGERTGEIVVRLDDVTRRHKKEQQEHQEQKMSAIGQLAGGVAHDFNNMLGGILGFAELVQESIPKEDESSLDSLAAIIEAAERASELTKRLLVFSRKGELVMEQLSPREVVESAVSLLSRTIDKKIKIYTSFPDSDRPIKGDMSQLQNAILNLGINARDALKEGGGEITVSLSNCRLDSIYCDESSFDIEPGEYVEFSIQDNGHGMTPEIQNKIFEPFFTTKESGKGTGLGLAAVFGTVTDHRGAISVYSEIERGTTFNLYLPVAVAEKKNKLVEREGANAKILGTGNILFIDDEMVIRKVGEKTLEKLGYSVVTAENGLKGVKKFDELHTSLDLVIVDMIMPEMSGDEVVAYIRAKDSDMPIIIASGFTGDKKLPDLTQQEHTYFIKKPFHKQDLGELIKEAMRNE